MPQLVEIQVNQLNDYRKIQVNPAHVIYIESSSEPNYCVITFSGGERVGVSGTLTDLTQKFSY